MNAFTKFKCTPLLSINLSAFNVMQQRVIRNVAKRSIKREMQAYLAQRWELASASNIKLSVNLRELNSEQLHTLCTPMYIFDGPVSHISSYTQYLGWIETGTGDIPGQYSTLTPLCREALVLYRVGVAPQGLQLRG